MSRGRSVTTKDEEISVFGGVRKDDSGNITLAKGLFNIDLPSNRSWNVIDVSGNTAPDSRRNFQAIRWDNPKNIDTSTLPGFDFTATFLEDDTTIIFIWGRKPNGKLMEMNQNVSGDTIKPRAAHSAVLDSLAVLDISSWTWSNPSFNNSNLPVPLFILRARI
ncbi:hypothetical protein G9A89_018265 [Geosiphon pyriformis]|nr:hypothetical protein G9A89_018265 [Geosiphon pyriformis]